MQNGARIMLKNAGVKMSELKTLKDFARKQYAEGKNIKYFDERELKAEAVKWVKCYYKSYTIGKMLEEQAVKGAFEDIEEKEKEVIEWIKHFFNLASEDLKDE